jgi:hypothetical protein
MSLGLVEHVLAPSRSDENKETPGEDRLHMTGTIILLDRSGSIVKAQRFQLHLPDTAFNEATAVLSMVRPTRLPPFLSEVDNETRLLLTKLIRPTSLPLNS